MYPWLFGVCAILFFVGVVTDEGQLGFDNDVCYVFKD